MQAWELIEQWSMANEPVEAELNVVRAAARVSDEARMGARRLLWVPPAVFGLANESMGLRSILRGCLGARMAKDWGAELTWTELASEREVLSAALSSLADVALRVHDGRAWTIGRKEWMPGRAGDPAGSPMRIIADALHRGLGDERARRAMRSAMERLDPDDEQANDLCGVSWSQWERESMSSVDVEFQSDGSQSKRL